MVGGLEEHNCVLPWFSSKVAPGYKPRIPCRKEEIRAQEGEIQKTDRGLRFNEGTKGLLQRKERFCHSWNQV